MAGGQFRHRVTIEQLTRTPDALGGYRETWTPVAVNCPARVTPVGVSAIEQLDAGQARVEAPQNFDVLLRWHPDRPQITDRLVFETRVLVIRGVEHVHEARRFVRVWCVEYLDGGP